MANSAEVDKSIYFVPESGWYPVFLAFGLMLTVTGLAGWLNDVSAGGSGDSTQSLVGFAIVALVLYSWFAKVIEENTAGLNNESVQRSYIWGMGWFIFSEVMFFAAFFWCFVLCPHICCAMARRRRRQGYSELFVAGF
jgi:cytochrome c oxidase subunit 3